MTPPPTGAPTRPGSTPGPSRFVLGMVGAGALSAAVQALFLRAASRRPTLPAIGRYDAVQAEQLVRGQWFVVPTLAVRSVHVLVPTALHPPLPVVLLAIADVAGATGAASHMVFLAVLFVASTVLAGVTVRDLVGDRAGILAALLFATFPLLWVNPATVGPETAVIAVVTLVLFASVRFWVRPSLDHAALLGLALGLATLARTDLAALLVMLGLPLTLLVKGVSWEVRARCLGLLVLVLLLVVAPWVGRNLAQFGHTTTLADLSEEYGPALAGAECATATSGSLAGWWNAGCLDRVPVAGLTEREATDAEVRSARTYATARPGAVARAAVDRLGRMWGVFRPGQTATLEIGTGRPAWVSKAGTWYLYTIAPLAVMGAVVLRRRRLLLFPFVALVLLACLTAVVAFGDQRYAVGADVALVLLAAVGLDAAWGRIRSRWSSGPGLHAAGGRSRALSGAAS